MSDTLRVGVLSEILQNYNEKFKNRQQKLSKRKFLPILKILGL